MAEALLQAPAAPPAREGGAEPVLAARGLSVFAGGKPLLRDVDLEVPPRRVLALLGSSGAGKTTLLRCFNRLVDLSPGLRVEGQVVFAGQPLYGAGIDADRLRARVGMLFQQPVVFPGSVYDNVLFGLRRAGRVPRRRWPERAEAALREAALWDEVKDRLRSSAATLSTGQQQRLCLARALALEPEVLLLDEPTSALDPRSTEAIEERVRTLAERRAIVLVTHDPAQARRLAHRVAHLARRDGAGEVVAVGGREILDQITWEVS